MKTQWCPKCESKVKLTSGIALLNPLGKVNSLGQFIPMSECHNGETVYPVSSVSYMIPVDKCPSCGYSIASV